MFLLLCYCLPGRTEGSLISVNKAELRWLDHFSQTWFEMLQNTRNARTKTDRVVRNNNNVQERAPRIVV